MAEAFPERSDSSDGDSCRSDQGDTPEVPHEWISEQDKLKKKLILDDADACLQTDENGDFSQLHYIGGLDISSRKDDVNASVALVIYSLEKQEIVHDITKKIKLTKPYNCGYLAFREVDFMVDVVEELKRKKPELMPQVIMVDGNGIHHPKGFGLASHLGVLLDIPTIGCAKSYLDLNSDKEEIRRKKEDELRNAGDTFDITHGDRVTGKALRSTGGSTNPIYVSQGHKVSLETAVKITMKCCKSRVPEPVNQADKISKRLLKEPVRKSKRRGTKKC